MHHSTMLLLILGSAWSPCLAYLPDVNIFTNYRTEVYNGKLLFNPRIS